MLLQYYKYKEGVKLSKEKKKEVSVRFKDSKLLMAI